MCSYCSNRKARIALRRQKDELQRKGREKIATLSDFNVAEKENCECGDFYNNRIVIGPNGELSNCILFYYQEKTIGNIRDFETINEVTNHITTKFNQKILQELREKDKKFTASTHPCQHSCAARELI